MKPALAAAILLLAATPAAAHRLDEYLQATLISVEKDRIQAEMRLTPGVAVLPIVLANIDTDGDGMISEAEQRTYAQRVLRDLSLSVDGNALPFRLGATKFPKVEAMKEGLGEIQLEITADLPPGHGHRRLVLENHHQSRIAAYLVNCLAPRDPDIRIAVQNRNYEQSFYQLDYDQAGSRTGLLSLSNAALGAFTLLLSARFVFLWRRRPRRGMLAPDLGSIYQKG
jgi:hypothetical protein